MQVKPFQNNDRVVFFGDSITHNNHYIMYVYNYYRKHFPNLNLRIYNSGIAGASIQTGFDFYDLDFRKWDANVVVVMYGMNDSRRDILECNDKKIREKTLNTAFKTYKENLDKMYHKLINDGYRVILCTPTPYDETNASDTPFLKGAAALIEKYADYVREYALKNNVELIDFNPYITELVKQRNDVIKEDHVHPTEEVGHIEMARCFLRHQGFDLDFDKLSPEYIKLDELVQNLRDIYASEFLFLDHRISHEEKLEKAKRFREEGDRDIYYDYFVFLAERYVKFNGDPELVRIEIEKQIDLINSRD